MKQVEIVRYLGITEAADSKWKKQMADEESQTLEMRTATDPAGDIG
jgi:hypothetical protein